MLYDISLRIAYRYTNPSAGSVHLMRLLPGDLADEQRLIAGHMDVDPPPAERRDGTDFFGNPTVRVHYRAAHDQIAVRVQARVRRLPRPGAPDTSPDLDALARELGAWRGLDALSPLHFTGASLRVPAEPAIAAYARDCLRPGMGVLDAVQAVGRALHADMAFDPGATTVDTPALTAFANRHGVCQDFSHVMIAGLRGIGIPAGYVSGFLRTTPPPGQPRLEGADAMHAWVRAWCGADVGWVEYDPTNAILAGGDHIVVARGRDYSDVAPVKGVLRVSGGQTGTHVVDVVPRQDE